MANGAGRKSKPASGAGTGGDETRTQGQTASGAQSAQGRSRRRAKNNGNGNANPGSGPGTQQQTPEGLLGALSGLLGQNGGAGTTVLSDAISQAVLLLLGSGPAVAAYQGLLSSQIASGRMFDQSVANQQRMNMLGMCTTAKCVRYMFDGDMEEIDEVEDLLKNPNSNNWNV
jgi:hypothetical protein